jgi:hypothetical protein
VLEKYQEMLDTISEDELNPYTKHMLRRLSSSIEDRYAFISSIPTIELPKQIVVNGNIIKRNQRPEIISKVEKEMAKKVTKKVTKKEVIQKEHTSAFVAPEQIQVAKDEQEPAIQEKEESVVDEKVEKEEQEEKEEKEEQEEQEEKEEQEDKEEKVDPQITKDIEILFSPQNNNTEKDQRYAL